jgi:hypothetical protein
MTPGAERALILLAPTAQLMLGLTGRPSPRRPSSRMKPAGGSATATL